MLVGSEAVRENAKGDGDTIPNAGKLLYASTLRAPVPLPRRRTRGILRLWRVRHSVKYLRRVRRRAPACVVRGAPVVKVQAVDPLARRVSTTNPVLAVNLRHNVHWVLNFARQAVDQRRVLVGQVDARERVALLAFLRHDALLQAALGARVADAAAHVGHGQDGLYSEIGPLLLVSSDPLRKAESFSTRQPRWPTYPYPSLNCVTGWLRAIDIDWRGIHVQS